MFSNIFLICIDVRAYKVVMFWLTLFFLSDHLDHIKNTIGADHAGLGGDFDGVTR